MGKEAKLCFAGHALMDNRHGLISGVCLTPSVGVTEPLHLGEGTLESAGYRASQIVRKRIEQFFSWGKTVGGLRKPDCAALGATSS
ncbi:MAG TPA: hypothetical protein VK794_03410 [Steroidobacteraceae bacterium]|nr:hypothetical protein [Steroidobacteraceae bacterium]